MMVSSSSRSSSSFLVSTRLLASICASCARKLLKLAIPIFQNILSKLLSSSSLSVLASSVKIAQLLNLKNLQYSILAALTASRTGGFLPSANVVISRILLSLSFSKMARMESKHTSVWVSAEPMKPVQQIQCHGCEQFHFPLE